VGEAVEEWFFLCFLGLTSLLALWIAKSAGFWRKVEQPLPLNLPSGINVITFFGAIFLSHWLIFAPIFWWIFGDGDNPLLFLLPMPFTTAFLALLFFLHPKSTRKAIFGKGDNCLYNLAFGFVTWFISYPCMAFIGFSMQMATDALFHKSELDQLAVRQLKAAADEPLLFVISALCVICLVPFVEELLFRGLLQGFFKRKLSPYKAIATTSCFFALAHYSFSQGIANVELLASLFILSLFLGYLKERQQTLWAPIGLHAVFNAVGVLRIAFLEHS
jgi:membrane protease YdiL (CAAX protease family)